MQNFGDIYEDYGESQQAIACHEEGLEIAREIGERETEAECLRGLGNAYNVLGDYEQAIVYFQQRLGVAEAVDDNLGRRDAYRGLGYAYDSLDYLIEAIYCERQRAAIAKELEDWQSAAAALSYLGYAYLNLQEYGAAQKSLLAALLIQEQQGDLQGQVFAFYNLASVCREQGDLVAARDFCQRGLVLARESASDLLEMYEELADSLLG